MVLAKVHTLRAKTPDSEKITINLGFVDLGHIDLMVEDGFYANRTDFIRTAIRNQLDRQADAVRQSVTRKTLDLGLRHYSRIDLEAVRDRGEFLAHQRAWPGHSGARRDARIGAGDDCLGEGAGGVARQSSGEGGTGRPH